MAPCQNELATAIPTRRSTRSAAVEKPAPESPSPESALRSRSTSASSMEDFKTSPSPARSDSKSPTKPVKRKSKSLSPEYEEDDVPPISRQSARRSSRKVSPTEPVYEVDDIIGDPLEFIQTPATREELEVWKGWVELESEPVSFSTNSPARLPSRGL